MAWNWLTATLFLLSEALPAAEPTVWCHAATFFLANDWPPGPIPATSWHCHQGPYPLPHGTVQLMSIHATANNFE